MNQTGRRCWAFRGQMVRSRSQRASSMNAAKATFIRGLKAEKLNARGGRTRFINLPRREALDQDDAGIFAQRHARPTLPQLAGKCVRRLAEVQEVRALDP